MASTIHKCTDGSDFSVEWEEEHDSELPWERDAAHYPLVATPLEIELNRLARSGRLRAFEEFGIQVPPLFRKFILPNGFFYMCPLRQVEDPQLQAAAVTTVIDKCGGALEVWEKSCLPKLQEGLKKLEAAIDAPLTECADIWGYSLWQTQVAATVLGWLFNRLSEFCQREFGAEGEALAFELTQGNENATVEADQALWDLAELSRTLPEVEAALIDPDDVNLRESLSAIPEAGTFLSAFTAFLNLYGRRTEFWQLVAPTWREHPEIPLRLIRQILLKGALSPVEITRPAAERRRSSVEGTAKRLSPTKLEEFSTLLAPCNNYVRIREGRAYWQLVVNGAMRHQILARGERLVKVGALAQKEDVFYLTSEEIDGATGPVAPGLNPAVEQRRKHHSYWSTKTAPHRIGRVTADAVSGRTESDPGGRIENLIKGIGASRGVVTARACVLTDLSEAERLEKGGVLVCVMTSPAWTSLFSIAGAIVTDSGGLLSHPSIAAREYGIPCVVGTRVGTQAIRDGTLITVDGTAGTVRIED